MKKSVYLYIYDAHESLLKTRDFADVISQQPFEIESLNFQDRFKRVKRGDPQIFVNVKCPEGTFAKIEIRRF